VDLQAVRDCLGGTWKRLTFANDEEIEAVTGCPCGAVAPIGMPEDVPVLFDEALTRHERVSISSGDLMLGLELDAANLLRVAHARLARIATRVA
jgi:Cys-tRNA(Pro)/Cys-tRNA(Cys) deacylase